VTDRQLSLKFDKAFAQQLADAGMNTALNADRAQPWRMRASAWLLAQPAGIEFTADDLVAVIGLPDVGVNRNNAVGAWVAAQARLGRIVWTNRYRRSARVVRHGNLQRVWRVIR